MTRSPQFRTWLFLFVALAATLGSPRAATAQEAAPDSVIASDGATELKVWGTLYGIWLGAAIPVALDVSSERAAGFAILVGGPTGFLAARAVTRARPLTKGQAGAITLGGSWGTWQGMGWSIVALWDEEDLGRRIVTSSIMGGLAGIAVGYGVSRKEIPDGLSLSVEFASLWGTWFGFLTSYLIHASDEEDCYDEYDYPDYCDYEDDYTGRAILAGTLLGGNAGLLGMAYAGRDWGLSVSRARIISLAGIMGAVGGLGIQLLGEVDGGRPAAALYLATSALGLGMGVYATREDSPAETASARPPALLGGSLLNRTGGRWSVSLPLPSPVPRPEVSPRARRGVTWRIPLLHLRF